MIQAEEGRAHSKYLISLGGGETTGKQTAEQQPVFCLQNALIWIRGPFRRFLLLWIQLKIHI